MHFFNLELNLEFNFFPELPGQTEEFELNLRPGEADLTGSKQHLNNLIVFLSS